MNKTELELAVQRYLKRPSLDNADFELALDMLHARLRTTLRSLWNEESVALTVADSSPITLPTDYGLDKRVEHDTGEPVSAAHYFIEGDGAGGATIRFREPVQAGDYTFRYFAALTLTTTNDVLTNAQHVYVYGASAEAAVLARDFRLAGNYFGLLDQEVARLRTQVNWSGLKQQRRTE